MEQEIPFLETNFKEALQVIAHQKFTQSYHLNWLTVEYYEMDDFIFYYTQFSFVSDFNQMFKILEASL